MARNIDAVDWWTLSHFAAGFVARKAGFTRNELIALVIIYELLERSNPPESFLNRVVDGLANVAGWELG